MPVAKRESAVHKGKKGVKKGHTSCLAMRESASSRCMPKRAANLELTLTQRRRCVAGSSTCPHTTSGNQTN